MKKKNKKHLTLYKKWLRDGKMPKSGLCYMIDSPIKFDYEIFRLLVPTDLDRMLLKNEGCNNIYWGSGEIGPKHYEFTPLRQTIILFMAAMSKEL